jgi:hypothetical protein
MIQEDQFAILAGHKAIAFSNFVTRFQSKPIRFHRIDQGNLLCLKCMFNGVPGLDRADLLQPFPIIQLQSGGTHSVLGFF